MKFCSLKTFKMFHLFCLPIAYYIKIVWKHAKLRVLSQFVFGVVKVPSKHIKLHLITKQKLLFQASISNKVLAIFQEVVTIITTMKLIKTNENNLSTDLCQETTRNRMWRSLIRSAVQGHWSDDRYRISWFKCLCCSIPADRF